jgi:flagellar basal-body rod modification protein FlgD
MSTVNGLDSAFTGQVSNQTASTSSSASSQQIGKSEFLILLVAQLKNQDPMNPVNNDQFITQLATFSSLEQLISINQAVTKLAGDSEETKSPFTQESPSPS